AAPLPRVQTPSNEPPSSQLHVPPTEPAMTAVRLPTPPARSQPAPRIPTPVSSVHPLVPDTERATLTVIHGVNAGATFILARARVLSGRDPLALVRVDEPAVSRCHALVERLPNGHYMVTDLQSTNGTFVAGHPIKRTELAPGSRIQLGPSLV